MNPESRLSWATPAPALIACAAGGVAMAVAAVFSPDTPSRILTGLAALGLLALAGLGFRQRPRLAIEGSSDPRLVVRGLSGATPYRREDIVRARLVAYRRLGRKTPMLEIDVEHDGAERLLIFGRWDLGTHPEEVHRSVVEHLRLSGKAAGS